MKSPLMYTGSMSGQHQRHDNAVNAARPLRRVIAMHCKLHSEKRYDVPGPQISHLCYASDLDVLSDELVRTRSDAEGSLT